MVQYSLVQRTGILSPNKTLRDIAKNILICVGWQGYLADFIGDLVKVLNYRPMELAVKLRATLQREAAAIGPYDMMFYSEVTKDLLKLFDEKDASILKNELQSTSAEAGAEGSAEEEKKTDSQKAAAEPVAAMTPAQMQALMMKQMAAAGKGKKAAAKPAAKGGAAGAKGAKPAVPAKPAAAQ